MVTATACSKGDTEMPESASQDYKAFAVEFTRTLARREYAAAFEMTSRQYRSQSTVEQLKAAFEVIVPPDWGDTEPIEMGTTMSSWPGKMSSDLGWIYVSIYGDVYSEALILTVTLEEGQAKIREIVFGRP
jgi:hypothetical protein